MATVALRIKHTLGTHSSQSQMVPPANKYWLTRALAYSWLVSSAALSMSSSTSQTKASLGATALRKLVIDAALHDEDKSLDLCGIMWLEHINVVVGSKYLAERFYFDLLGLTKDQSPSFHANLGQQQFHLAENGEPAQRVTGSIGLVVPTLAALRQRVAAAIVELKDTHFKVIEDTEECMTITCPWGNRMHLYDAEVDTSRLESQMSDSTQKMVLLHAKGGSYAASRMSVRGNPGIRFVEMACRVGTAHSIARFYKEMMDCTVSTPSVGQALVSVGPGVHLVFVEDSELSEQDTSLMEGLHICIYAADFEGLYKRLAERSLIWTNPRFTHLDSCDTWEEAAASRTLRFKDIVDVSTGQKIFELEHETRPLRHGQYLKVPKYEAK
jgi:catechol-2,3-dioxygenase